DGKADLVVANEIANTISVLLGNGDGTFQAAKNTAVGKAPVSLAVFKVNNDANKDLAVANFHSDTVSVLAGKGDGTFIVFQTLETGAGPTSVVPIDANGDQVPDLAVANQLDDTVSLFLGKRFDLPVGKIHLVFYRFRGASLVDAGAGPTALVTRDFNGDGNYDLAVTNVYSNSVSVLLGNGDGTFQDPENYAAGDGPMALAIGDFNGDLKIDLVVVDLRGNELEVLRTLER